MTKFWFVSAVFFSMAVFLADGYQQVIMPNIYTRENMDFSPFNPFGKLNEKLDEIIKLIQQNKIYCNPGKIETLR